MGSLARGIMYEVRSTAHHHEKGLGEVSNALLRSARWDWSSGSSDDGMLAEPPAAPIGKRAPQTIPWMSVWIRWIRRRTYDAARGVEAALSLARGGKW